MEIKFLKYKKFRIVAIAFVIFALLFSITYLVTYNITRMRTNVNFVNKNNYEIISKNNMRDVVVVSENSNGELLEKSRMKLEITDINKVFKEMYPIGGYEIINFDDKSIILKETSNRNFSPNMYYIGEKDGYITVFKSDDKGNLFIENEKLDISSKRVESLPFTDRELVINYELKSNEREEVQDILSELET